MATEAYRREQVEKAYDRFLAAEGQKHSPKMATTFALRIGEGNELWGFSGYKVNSMLGGENIRGMWD